MANENKTLWKKNLDSKFISGEDLKLGVKDLKPEMVVQIEKFDDAETFDQNQQAKRIVTELWLREVGGERLYKPVILNKTNAKFFVKETGSDYVDDWVGRPVILYAVKDSRHGHVVRFKSYILPTLVNGSDNFKACRTALKSGGYTMAQIKMKYQVSESVEKLLISE
jgi:hypothetical protein